MCGCQFTDMENEGGVESSKVKWLDLERTVVGLCGAWTASHPVLMPLVPATPALYTTPSCQAAAAKECFCDGSHFSLKLLIRAEWKVLCQRAAARPSSPMSHGSRCHPCPRKCRLDLEGRSITCIVKPRAPARKVNARMVSDSYSGLHSTTCGWGNGVMSKGGTRVHGMTSGSRTVSPTAGGEDAVNSAPAAKEHGDHRAARSQLKFSREPTHTYLGSTTHLPFLDNQATSRWGNGARKGASFSCILLEKTGTSSLHRFAQRSSTALQAI